MRLRNLLCLYGGVLFCSLLVGDGLAVADETSATHPTARSAQINVIAGQVVDHEGKPVPDAQVAVAHVQRGYIFYSGGDSPIQTFGSDKRILLFFKARNGRASIVVTTDENGRFEAKSLLDGDYNVLAHHPTRGIAVLPKAASPQRKEDLRIELAPPAFVTGTIKGLGDKAHEGSSGPWARGLTDMAHLSPLLDKQGISISLYIDVKPSGEFKVGPLPADGSAWQLKVEHHVLELAFNAPMYRETLTPESGKTIRLDVDLTRGEVLSGEVKGPSGEALENVSVTVRTTDPPETLYGALTDKSGKYTIRGLSPRSYKLEAKRWAKRTKPG